jgi:hypothetical protein
VLAIVLAAYVGFARRSHMRFIEREPMLTGLLKVVKLPPQPTFWRFLASLRIQIAGQASEYDQSSGLGAQSLQPAQCFALNAL